MPDTLNPESLRRARTAYHSAAGAVSFWDRSTAPPTLEMRLSYNPSAGVEAAIRAYLAAEGERVQSIGLVRASVAEMRRQHAARHALRDAIGDLLHMHRQGAVSAEMWERVAAALDGAKP